MEYLQFSAVDTIATFDNLDNVDNVDNFANADNVSSNTVEAIWDNNSEVILQSQFGDLRTVQYGSKRC